MIIIEKEKYKKVEIQAIKDAFCSNHFFYVKNKFYGEGWLDSGIFKTYKTLANAERAAKKWIEK